MLIDQFAANGLAGAHAGVVGPLWRRIAALGETQRQVRLRVDDGVFLLEAEPEIVVVFVDGGAPVGLVGAAVGVEHLAHDLEAVAAEAVGIGKTGDGLELAVGGVAGGLLGR